MAARILANTNLFFSFLGLDFIDTVRLVNYIRSEVRKGNLKPDVSSKSRFEDDLYMKPVLEDDALLYNLDDIAEGGEEGIQVSNKEQAHDTQSAHSTFPDHRIQELEEELSRLRSDFTEYKSMVKRQLSKELADEDSVNPPTQSASAARKFNEAESGYFSSYSYNGMRPSIRQELVLLANLFSFFFYSSDTRIHA